MWGVDSKMTLKKGRATKENKVTLEVSVLLRGLTMNNTVSVKRLREALKQSCYDTIEEWLARGLLTRSELDDFSKSKIHKVDRISGHKEAPSIVPPTTT